MSKFKKGDHVVITEKSSKNNHNFKIGSKGIIMVIGSLKYDSIFDYYVKSDDEEEIGWWVLENEIELITNDWKERALKAEKKLEYLKELLNS